MFIINMPFILKPVGTSGPKRYEIKNDKFTVIKLFDIHTIFKDFGMNDEELDQIKFVANSETIKNNDKSYIINNDENLIIFVFSPIKEIKNKIEDIFIKNNTNTEEVTETIKIIDPTIQQNIDEKIEEDLIPILDDETVKLINEKTVKLFENDDFKNLVRIYYSNQDTMKTFLNFIVHGDIVKLNIPKNIFEKSYENEINILKSLGIKESDEVLNKYLNNYNGHINLTLRAILCKQALI